MFLKEPINIVLCHELLWKNHQHCSKRFTATYLSKWRDDQNVHVLKFLKAEGLSTLFYQFQNCCGISKENRGITNIVLQVQNRCVHDQNPGLSTTITANHRYLRVLFSTKQGGMLWLPPGSFVRKAVRLPSEF